MSLKLNSISLDNFKVNTADTKMGRISRNELIATGRLVTMEYNGRLSNKVRNKSEYKTRMDDIAYTNLSSGHKKNLLMFCAAQAYAVQGKPAPEDFAQVQNDLGLLRDRNFLATLAGISREIITPLLPYTISNMGGLLMETTTVPLGQTKEITVHSNDIFLFEDSSWGASRSTTMNYLYDDTITLNPRPYTCRAVIKWYQMVGNDVDIGWYYNAIMGGMYSRIMANYIGAIMTLADNSPYIPDYLTFDTYNSQNWAEAIVATSTANGIPRNQLMAFGDYRDLQKVLPLGTPSDAALTYGLGEEWMRNGFLSVVGGVPLFDVDPAMVPGTVNTTGEMLGMKGLILISGRIGRAYAPVYTAFAEGSPLVIEMEPRESGDNSIYIDCTAVMDTKIVMGSKIAAIQMPS